MTDALKNDPLLPLVTEIVVAYLSHNTVAMSDIPRLIAAPRMSCPLMLGNALCFGVAGRVLADRHGIEFQAMADQAIAELRRNTLLQAFDLLIGELDDATGLDVDQMVVMIVLGFFITRPAVAKIATLQDARFLEQAHGAVGGGKRDAGIDLRCATVQQFDIRMVLGFRQDARDDPTLVGHLQPFFNTQPLQP